MTGLKNIIRSMKGNRSLYSSLLLQTVIMIYISTISADLQHLNRDPQKDLQPNKNTVTTYDECKKYLCKYGYLNCDCQEHLMRKKRQLPDMMMPTEYNVVSDVTSTVAPELTDVPESTKPDAPVLCNELDFISGLQVFQKNYRLTVTGVCDERTTAQMSQRRCGQPDTVIDKLDSELAEEKEVKREKRSLSDIINRNVELEQAIDTRKRQLQQYLKDIENEETIPQERQGSKPPTKREKRSQISVSSSDYGGPINKQRVSWRLMSNHLSHVIPAASQRSIMKQAFRYWSEVSPLCFYEVGNPWDSVDIEIGFLEGQHLSCYRQFDGYGGEIAHKYYRDVHFDNSEPYTEELTSDTRISLLLVAVHELGHVIGLNHSDVPGSVMNAIYHQSIHGMFELSTHDRIEMRNSYGPCYGKFNTAFDFVTTRAGTKNTRVYNTFFFRGDHFWKYENMNQRTKYGDPRMITPNWSSLPPHIDTFLHYFSYSTTTQRFYDEYLFILGDRYYQYDHSTSSVIRSGLLRAKFPAFNSTSLNIPSNPDAAFFDVRTSMKVIYFFDGNKVYTYNYNPNGPVACCTTVTDIVTLFPPVTHDHLTSPDGNTYASDIDVAYFSNYHRAMYFIKGNDVWRNELYTVSQRANSMRYLGKWYDIWQFICEGDCS